MSGYTDLYDALIDGIPGDIAVADIVQGAGSYFVRSGETFPSANSGGSDGGIDVGAGVCSAMAETYRQPILAAKAPGMPLRELAACVKSWDFREAGLGLCAINAYYNSIPRLRALGVEISDARHIEDRAADPFITRQKDVRGKTVTIIGRFPYINSLFAPVCNLRVVEKFRPEGGDYPEQALDYLLPDSDYVFVSTYTIVEKTLPRILELSANACVTIVGPACPTAPVLFGYGVHCLAGFALKYPEIAKNAALGLGGSFHQAGQKISLDREAARLPETPSS